jgi:hypothetical protein
MVYSADGVYSLSPIIPVRYREEVMKILEKLQGEGKVTCSRIGNQPDLLFAVGARVIGVLPFQDLISCLKPQKEVKKSISSPIFIDCDEEIRPNSALRERFCKIRSLHSLCEEYMESIGLSASEYLSQEGPLKQCRIELGGTVVVIGRAEGWKQARARAALEVMYRLDKDLCESWLTQHITEFTAFVDS